MQSKNFEELRRRSLQRIMQPMKIPLDNQEILDELAHAGTVHLPTATIYVTPEGWLHYEEWMGNVIPMDQMPIPVLRQIYVNYKLHQYQKSN